MLIIYQQSLVVVIIMNMLVQLKSNRSFQTNYANHTKIDTVHPSSLCQCPTAEGGVSAHLPPTVDFYGLIGHLSLARPNVVQPSNRPTLHWSLLRPTKNVPSRRGRCLIFGPAEVGTLSHSLALQVIGHASARSIGLAPDLFVGNCGWGNVSISHALKYKSPLF